MGVLIAHTLPISANYGWRSRGQADAIRPPLSQATRVRLFELETEMFKRIVVGCDGTPEGHDAIVLGSRIAAATGAGLSLVGVFPVSLFPIKGTSDRRTLQAQTEKTLHAEREVFAPAALVHAVTDYSVPRALQHFAERWRADLIVIGSNPTTPAGHAGIGRRGRQLLVGSPFAVAVAQRGLHERQFELAKIGVGYDAGPEAESALEFAATIARGAGARLSVMSVVEDHIPALTPSEWIASSGHEQRWEHERTAALLATETRIADLGVVADASALVGDPGLKLRALSQMMDLIVVGSRRWGVIARLVSGSVGETLVSDAGSSVLVVSRPRAATHGSREPASTAMPAGN
jgi:nucleotide-binding universal stress UspA family protein